MKLDKQHNKASLIALAWPDTKVRRIGVWYDQVTQWLGFIDGDYYKAGHAASVLVDHSTGALQYFDFGRYHTPEKMGRLRSHNTDPELKLQTKARTSRSGEIKNIEEILIEISAHPATHGDGVMYAGVAKNIDAKKALHFTMKLQESEMSHYGPFDIRGTNCSRFVRDIVKKSTQCRLTKFRLAFPWTLTPATKWVARNAATDGKYFEVNGKVSLHQKTSLSIAIKQFLTWFELKAERQMEPMAMANVTQNSTINESR